MALFNWFPKKSDSAKGMPDTVMEQTRRSPPAAASSGVPLMSPMQAAPTVPAPLSRQPEGSADRMDERKARRHGRREQLYTAIRQAMTRAGVLSASFKFKVLSLDQSGDQFLVMMDVHPSLGLQEHKLVETEALVMQIAGSQFGIVVTAVYWRIDTAAEFADTKHSGFESRPAPLASAAGAVQVPSFKQAAVPRFEPIRENEVTAFKSALKLQEVPAAPFTAGQSGLTSSLDNPANNAKSRDGLRSFTLMTGFEDTEMADMAEMADLPDLPGLPASRALSTTQYGELN